MNLDEILIKETEYQEAWREYDSEGVCSLQGQENGGGSASERFYAITQKIPQKTGSQSDTEYFVLGEKLLGLILAREL